ncbi:MULTISPECIES: formate dehydrogenase accessory sulfurtransferase FdhD [Methylobacillus]|uniref:formate dehydrogenase accessory sulfurtransferase FdhD n=1 Tax=Methylobacillus TaxID=404 RepID=UPI0012CA688A|nr:MULTISPECIES: formate dehydrogenase accessory sulfurtransferase FdhD [Methylobacillus]MDR5170793.1 formate dehydrogenase accessory sulfurtransferase FdhD [Methylobacillus flagellatus]MPS49646.1 formate dehydrogenase accessory sulfurtransferase FdhD [Methylobacillus sp.]
MNASEFLIEAEATDSRVTVLKYEHGELHELQDQVAEEVPVAMIYNGISHAVMLATPDDLTDFALGFSLCEGILSDPKELYGIDIVERVNGIELQMEIASENFVHLKERRRSMAGRTGCGLCGSESLDQAIRVPRRIQAADITFDAEAIYRAQRELQAQQALQGRTGATHASAWADREGKVLLVREDVGRHNALDKLIGALAERQLSREGFVLTSSRASYEMVQKAASADIPMLVAISAPTGLAIRMAQGCGLTLVGFARKEQHVVYSVAERLLHKELA